VHEEGTDLKSKDSVHQTIEEAQLFVDASHQCYARLGAQLSQPVVA